MCSWLSSLNSSSLIWTPWCLQPRSLSCSSSTLRSASFSSIYGFALFCPPHQKPFNCLILSVSGWVGGGEGGVSRGAASVHGDSARHRGFELLLPSLVLIVPSHWDDKYSSDFLDTVLAQSLTKLLNFVCVASVHKPNPGIQKFCFASFCLSVCFCCFYSF